MYQYLTLTPDLAAAFSRLCLHECNDSSHARMKKDSEAVPTERCSYKARNPLESSFLSGHMLSFTTCHSLGHAAGYNCNMLLANC